MATGGFNLQDMHDIMIGAHFYACGGGGSAENGKALIKEVIKVLKSNNLEAVEYITPEQLPDDAWLPVLGAMGAPKKFLEEGYCDSPLTAFQAHQEKLRVRLANPSLTFYSMLAAETGTIAYGMALLVAAANNLPIVDGDGAGRAVPCLPMLSFANPKSRIQISPSVLTSETPVNDGGALLSFDCNQPTVLDELIRAVISSDAGFEQRASLSCFAMQGAQLKQDDAVAKFTLTHTRDFGKALRQSKDPINTVIEQTHGQLILKGAVIGCKSITAGGFDRLEVYLKDDKDVEYTIVAQNENMLLWSNNVDTPLVLSPDLICYLNPQGKEEGLVYSNSEISSHFSGEKVFEQYTRDGKPQSLPLALFAVQAPEFMYQDYYQTEYAKVFKEFGYYGSYHEPMIGDRPSRKAANAAVVEVVL